MERNLLFTTISYPPRSFPWLLAKADGKTKKEKNYRTISSVDVIRKSFARCGVSFKSTNYANASKLFFIETLNLRLMKMKMLRLMKQNFIAYALRYPIE